MLFDDLCNSVCQKLPPGWNIEIRLERGCGEVLLWNHDGDRLNIDEDGSLQDQIAEAMKIAMKA